MKRNIYGGEKHSQRDVFREKDLNRESRSILKANLETRSKESSSDQEEEVTREPPRKNEFSNIGKREKPLSSCCSEIKSKVFVQLSPVLKQINNLLEKGNNGSRAWATGNSSWSWPVSRVRRRRASNVGTSIHRKSRESRSVWRSSRRKEPLSSEWRTVDTLFSWWTRSKTSGERGKICRTKSCSCAK